MTRETEADPRQNNSIIRSSPEADSVDGAEEREDERQFAILVCPECGEQTVFSAMDASHGVEARCYRHGMEETAGGGMQVKRGPELVPLIVVPKRQLEQVQAERDERDAALRELVRLYELKQSDPNAYAMQAEQKRLAWYRAKGLLSRPPEQQGEGRP